MTIFSNNSLKGKGKGGRASCFIVDAHAAALTSSYCSIASLVDFG
jgi:hypothetical protein